jgi:hypothetical protein
MEITLETLRKFVRDNGTVSVLDSASKTKKLLSGSANSWEIALKADKFYYAGARYSRADFQKLMDTMTTRPGDVTQIG